MSEIFETGENKPQNNRHFLGLLAGIGTGIIVGLILAGIGALLKSEFLILVLIGLIVVGIVVSKLVPNQSAMGAITGGLSCGIAFLAYQFFLALFGYSYSENYVFWIMLAGAIIYGGYMGYRGKKGFEEE